MFYKKRVMSQRKIFIFTVPATGHSNGIFVIAKELIEQKNCQVIIYSTEYFKSQILKTGSEYRKYHNKSIDYVMPNLSIFDENFAIKNRKINHLLTVMQKMLDFTPNIVMELVKDIENDKPDLILYDQIAIPAKYALRILRERKGKQVKSIMYYTTFAQQKFVYPNSREIQVSLNINYMNFFEQLYGIIRLTLTQYYYCFKFGLRYFNIVYDTLYSIDKLNICLVNPYLQPRYHLFNKSVKFIGCCLNDEVMAVEDSRLKNVLNYFEVINPCDDSVKFSSRPKKLIYASLGTFFTSDFSLYEKIINCFVNFDDEPHSKIQLDQVTVVFSLGQKAFDHFSKLSLPSNIILAPTVPQIEILKRASVFITHGGMNSTSETVHFGVPVVCIPLAADQPLVARRIANDLGFGIKLCFVNLTSELIRNAVHTVLNDFTYHERILHYSKLSHKYRGEKVGADLITNFITKMD